MKKVSSSDQPATKADIQRIETSLKKFATKEDLKKFATKTELRRVEKSLRGEILRVEEKVENLEEGQKRIETTVNKTANVLDAFLGRLDNLEIDNKVGANQTRDLRVRVDNHEERISRLE
nr:hypothetical protein [Candidatus Levybacteria bacterium]